jgi:hypothetical protein
LIEEVRSQGTVLALVIRRSYAPGMTTFPTPSSYTQQLGFVVYPAGGAVVPHIHRPVRREITGTAEVIVVRSGRCVVDLYSEERALVASYELETGDVILLVAGGHGFRMLDNTVLMEVKQGPYMGVDEKERF